MIKALSEPKHLPTFRDKYLAVKKGAAALMFVLISVCSFGQNTHVVPTGSPSPSALGSNLHHYGRVFNVIDYGAIGNAKDVTDAGMASNTTVSSVTAAFVPADAGKSCIMYGSGAAGINQVGTITAYISATQVTVSFTAAATVTNKEFFFGTESTTGIQAAINACDAVQGGKVWLPSGVYFIGGALVTSQNGSNPNCQIYIPFHTYFVGQFEFQIDIEGEQTVNLNSGYFGTPNVLPTTGVVLRSVISGSGTAPAIIGSGDATHQTATAVFFRNFTIQAYTNQGTVAPALTGLNGGSMGTISTYRVGAALDVNNLSSADPSSTESAGIIVSFRANAGPNVVEHSSAMGYKYGIIVNEHTRLENPFVFSCVYAYVFPRNDFTITGFALYHACKNGVFIPNATVMGQPSGAVHLFNVNFECEIDTAAGTFGTHWFNTFVSHVNDPGNNGLGIIKTRSILGGTGATSTLVSVGAANLLSMQYNDIAPSDFNSTAPNLPIGGTLFQSLAADNQIWGSNIFFNSGGYKYKASAAGEAINLGAGGVFINLFPSGTGGAGATVGQAINFTTSGVALSKVPLVTAVPTTAYPSITFTASAGVDPSSITRGMMWDNATRLYYGVGAAAKVNLLPLEGSGTLDFPSTAAGAVADLTMTVTGAAVGDPVFIGIPNGSLTTTATFWAWVSATNTVTIRYSPKATEDPASGTFKITVWPQ